MRSLEELVEASIFQTAVRNFSRFYRILYHLWRVLHFNHFRRVDDSMRRLYVHGRLHECSGRITGFVRNDRRHREQYKVNARPDKIS